MSILGILSCVLFVLGFAGYSELTREVWKKKTTLRELVIWTSLFSVLPILGLFIRKIGCGEEILYWFLLMTAVLLSIYILYFFKIHKKESNS